MKKIYLVFALPLLITACKPKGQSSDPKTDSVAYAYTIPKPDNWTIDTNTTDTKTALNALKSYETGDTAHLRTYLTDTVTFNYDGGNFKGPVKQFLTNCKMSTDSGRKVSIKMTDWEPVISKDGKEKWVTLWYTQTETDAKGKVDSVGDVNDILFKNSKIVRIDEYKRSLKP
jgi:hypothetical protein